MNRHPLKQKFWKLGNDKVKEIQDYFLNTGDTDVNIGLKFGIEKTMAQRITKDALNKKQDEIKRAKAQTQS